MRQARLRAIGYMLAAVFSCMDALLKLLSAWYPPLQVAVLRGAASLPFTLLPLVISGRGIAIDRVVWHVLPSARVVLGGCVVIVSALYLIWRERAQAVQVPSQQA